MDVEYVARPARGRHARRPGADRQLQRRLRDLPSAGRGAAATTCSRRSPRQSRRTSSAAFDRDRVGRRHGPEAGRADRRRARVRRSARSSAAARLVETGRSRPERDLDVDRLAVAQHAQGEHVARAVQAEDVVEALRRVDSTAVDGRDDVARQEAGLLCRAAVDDRRSRRWPVSGEIHAP